jgi:hypothetical protein
LFSERDTEALLAAEFRDGGVDARGFRRRERGGAFRGDLRDVAD